MSAGYAELHCLSNFSFQRGASSARELFERAKHHGYQALAITDECTLAGIVRAWQASKEVGLPLVTGSEMRVEGGPKLVLLAEDLAGYQALCRIITAARRRAPKGEYRLLREDFEAGVEGLLALWVPDCVGAGAPSHSAVEEGADWLRALFPDRLWIAVELHRGADDATEAGRAQDGLRKLMQRVSAMDGAISGEHGIGLAKSPFMHLQHGPAELNLMRRIKRLFDPNNILNPGKIFPVEEPALA